MPGACVDCGRQTPNRRCLDCDRDRRVQGPSAALEVVCDCGFRVEWTGLNDFGEIAETHRHEETCDYETRYQALGDGGGPQPTRQRALVAGGGEHA